MPGLLGRWESSEGSRATPSRETCICEDIPIAQGPSNSSLLRRFLVSLLHRVPGTCLATSQPHCSPTQIASSEFKQHLPFLLESRLAPAKLLLIYTPHMGTTCPCTHKHLSAGVRCIHQHTDGPMHAPGTPMHAQLECTRTHTQTHSIAHASTCTPGHGHGIPLGAHG